MSSIQANYGWAGTVRAFLDVEKPRWLQTLETYHQQQILEAASDSQKTAWGNCYSLLRRELQELVTRHPDAATWTCIFEYELPRERGRRPDVILLAGDSILVLEFKDYSNIRLAHLDQVSAYARDISEYHSASHNRRVLPYLVLTQAIIEPRSLSNVTAVGRNGLAEVLATATSHNTGVPIRPEEWLSADYRPLPTLVNAARSIFQHEPLPAIRRAQSVGIPETVEALVSIARAAESTGTRHLALVTGVPGAGKTLVGLQFVYERHSGNGSTDREAVFLSGNGPLVQVLQHALDSKVFVQDVHGFLKQYGGNRQRAPEEHVWVYDEAQRAWDADQVREKRGHHFSEPEDFLRLGERKSWACLVGLIGEGQEIHIGEESGLAQWNDALSRMSQPWTVHCPDKISNVFASAANVQTNNDLDLNTSLRSHLAEDIQRWVELLLQGQLAAANTVASRVRNQAFEMYVTRNLEGAKRYVQERYSGQESQRFGLLASSKAKNVAAHGVNNEFNYTRNLRVGPWYNDPPESPKSCCQLQEVATEFSCQGLELDFPIIAWGNDLKWDAGRWISPPQRNSKAKNPHQLRVNSYRVLLTRGRDGFIVFVPPEAEMSGTYQALVDAGLQPVGG